MAKKKIEKGSAVHLVTARGEHVLATVTNVRKDNLVDLEIAALGTAEKPMILAHSPYDEAGKKADSWHEVEETALPAETK